MRRCARALLYLMCSSALTLGLAACGSAVSTSSFPGAEHEVAQTIANLQSNATAGEEKKVCANDIASSVLARLGGAKACEAAIKNQLAEVDNLEVKVQSIQLPPGGKGVARAQVTSIRSGKTQANTVSLVKEDGKWRISGVS